MSDSYKASAEAAKRGMDPFSESPEDYGPEDWQYWVPRPVWQQWPNLTPHQRSLLVDWAVEIMEREANRSS